MSQPDLSTASIAWNPGQNDRLLIAGDEFALPTIETLLATLPVHARGQVFIEVEGADDVRTLEAPGRVTVCWLLRERGQELRRSIDAWLSEMLPVDFSAEHRVYAWIAPDGAARVLSSD